MYVVKFVLYKKKGVNPVNPVNRTDNQLVMITSTCKQPVTKPVT